MVYIYAKSKNYSVSVGKIGSFECDFIVRSPSLGFAYIQVFYSILLSKETEDREYSSLEKLKIIGLSMLLQQIILFNKEMVSSI